MAAANTYKGLRETLDKCSMFCDGNPLVAKSVGVILIWLAWPAYVSVYSKSLFVQCGIPLTTYFGHPCLWLVTLVDEYSDQLDMNTVPFDVMSVR